MSAPVTGVLPHTVNQVDKAGLFMAANRQDPYPYMLLAFRARLMLSHWCAINDIQPALEHLKAMRPSHHRCQNSSVRVEPVQKHVHFVDVISVALYYSQWYIRAVLVEWHLRAFVERT